MTLNLELQIFLLLKLKGIIKCGESSFTWDSRGSFYNNCYVLLLARARESWIGWTTGLDILDGESWLSFLPSFLPSLSLNIHPQFHSRTLT